MLRPWASSGSRRPPRQTIEAHAGDIVVAPAEAPHSFVNSGSGVLRSVDIHPVYEMETVWL